MGDRIPTATHSTVNVDRNPTCLLGDTLLSWESRKTCLSRLPRVIHVAKFADAVYVLHCFQKKTEKTNKADLELAAKRYRDVLKELSQ